MDSYLVSDVARKGDPAALRSALASGRAATQEELAFLLRINAGFSHVECVKILLQQRANPSMAFCSFRSHGQLRRGTGQGAGSQSGLPS